MSVPPTTVIFDYGNVLCLPQNRSEVVAMAAVFDAAVPAFEEHYWKDRLAFDQAAITPEAYWGTIAGALSRNLSDAQRERLIELDNLSWARPEPIMVQWAVELHDAGVRTAVLSNMPITVRMYLQRSCAWLPQFDFSCYSCDLKQTKPGPEIYLHCLKGLGIAPGEALFLDDREENVAAARLLGIHAIHFSSPEQAQCEINQTYNLPVPIPFQANCAGRASRSQSSF